MAERAPPFADLRKIKIKYRKIKIKIRKIK